MVRRFDVRALPWLFAVVALAQPLRAQQQQRPASAQPAATPQATRPAPTFSLRVTAPRGCPGEPELLEAILGRVPEARRVSEGAGEVALAVELSDGGLSTLEVSLAEGSSRRELRDTSCEEASATLALIASLVLDAQPGERLGATESIGKDGAAPAATAVAPASAAPTVAAPRSVESAPPSQPKAEQQGAGAELRFGLQLGLALETAVAPTPPIGAVAGFSLRFVRQSVWSPELRAELVATSAASEAVATGEVKLRLLAARLSACPLRAPLGPVDLSGCATFDGGSLTATGSPEIEGESSAMPWLALGLAARAGVALSRAWELELAAGVKRLMHHDHFTVDPDLLVYDVPPYSGGFSAGLGFVF